MIQKKRIRKTAKYLSLLKENESFHIGVRMVDDNQTILEKLGLSSTGVPGEQVLPAATFGPISLFNAEGGVNIRKDLEKETAYRQMEWTWKQWRGRYDYEEKSKIVDVPYKRYPREKISPPGVELMVIEENGRLWLISPQMTKKESNEKENLHVINLFLEIFGQAEILSKGFSQVISPKVIRLNWRILPQGEYPWESDSQHVRKIVQTAAAGNQVVIKSRIKSIEGYNPDFVAVGQNGFHGYLIYGFPSRNIFILESIYTGNATYIFRKDWKSLSKLTKGEILSSKLQYKRLIHRKTWAGLLKQVFSDNPSISKTA